MVAECRWSAGAPSEQIMSPVELHSGLKVKCTAGVGAGATVRRGERVDQVWKCGDKSNCLSLEGHLQQPGFVFCFFNDKSFNIFNLKTFLFFCFATERVVIPPFLT